MSGAAWGEERAAEASPGLPPTALSVEREGGD